MGRKRGLDMEPRELTRVLPRHQSFPVKKKKKILDDHSLQAFGNTLSDMWALLLTNRSPFLTNDIPHKKSNLHLAAASKPLYISYTTAWNGVVQRSWVRYITSVTWPTTTAILGQSRGFALTEREPSYCDY